MTVAELIAALQALPPAADVYVSEPPEDGWTQYTERDPFITFEDDGSIYVETGKRAHPHGRVKL